MARVTKTPATKATPPQAKKKTRAKAAPFEYASAGRYTEINEDGSINQNMVALSRMATTRHAATMSKRAGMFGGDLGGGADIAESNNIGYYSFQFPVDSLEMPSSRPQELEFYRLAYTRDPIVARGIDLHTELPLSKIDLEKPKCSVDSFSDYVFDFFQRLMNDTKFFATMIKATREYYLVGEAFLFVEQPESFGELVVSDVAAEAIKKGRGYQAGVSPLSEGANGPKGGEKAILPDFITNRSKAASKVASSRVEKLEMEFADEGLKWDTREDPTLVHKAIVKHKLKLAKLVKKASQVSRIAKLANQKLAVISAAENAMIEKAADLLVAEELQKRASFNMIAAPGDEVAEAAPVDAGGDLGADPGAIPEDGAVDGAEGVDGGEGELGGDPLAGIGGGGGFGGGGGGGSIPSDQAEQASAAVGIVEDAQRHREIGDLKRYIHLLERKKQLLEELKEKLEQNKLEEEIFSHVVNKDYEGFERIQVLQIERISLADGDGDGPAITYKPSEEEKEGYLSDPNVPSEIKNKLAETGELPMNTNPYLGSYVIHFARKQGGSVLHGQSVLQACMRSIIYREKLRQVQTTLASRNMTPKTLITAPGVSELQIAQLRVHADEAIASPDFVIVTNYECTWNEIGSTSRLLNLTDEWNHTNSNLAVGLGFSPEILMGESMFSGGDLQLRLMSTTYMAFRDEISDVIENGILKPVAMIKSFYEKDDYGRPRWIYPKVTFSALALKDSSDLFEIYWNLFSSGVLPISTVYDLLGLDAHALRKELEDDMFTVSEAGFSQAVSSMYSAIGGDLVAKTDVINRLAKNMKLTEKAPDADALEGTGSGM